MKYYFAYGSCMDLQDIRRTEPKAKLIGVGRLHGYRLAFTRWAHSRSGGVADVVQATENDYVEGIIFGVPNFKALDIREGAPYAYQQTAVEIYDITNDEWVNCTTYTVTKKAKKCEYKPSYEYVKLILSGATRLTPEYQAVLFANLEQERRSTPPKKKKKRVLAHPSFVPPPVRRYYNEPEEFGDIDDREAGAYDDRDLYDRDLWGFDPDAELARRLKWLDE